MRGYLVTLKASQLATGRATTYFHRLLNDQLGPTRTITAVIARAALTRVADGGTTLRCPGNG